MTATGPVSPRAAGAAAWQAMKNAVTLRPIPAEPTIFGSDISGDMIAMTRHNLERAGVRFDVASWTALRATGEGDNQITIDPTA